MIMRISVTPTSEAFIRGTDMLNLELSTITSPKPIWKFEHVHMQSPLTPHMLIGNSA